MVWILDHSQTTGTKPAGTPVTVTPILVSDLNYIPSASVYVCVCVCVCVCVFVCEVWDVCFLTALCVCVCVMFGFFFVCGLLDICFLNALCVCGCVYTCACT